MRLPKIFGDHMVLQRDKPINVWGWAEPGEDVKVTLGAASASTKAGAYRIGTVPQQGLRRKPYIPTGNDVEIEGGFRGERGIFLCWVPGLRDSKPSATTASTPTNPAAKPPPFPTASSGYPNPSLLPNNHRPPKSFSSPPHPNAGPATCALCGATLSSRSGEAIPWNARAARAP